MNSKIAKDADIRDRLCKRDRLYKRKIRKIGYEDGITIESSLIKGKKEIPAKILLIQICFMLFGVYGTLFCLISGLSIPINTKPVYVIIIISTLLFLISHLAKRLEKYILIVILGIYVRIGYILWIKIENGFWHIENICITLINQYYNSNIYGYKVDKSLDQSQVVTLFVIFVTVLLAFFISQSILGHIPTFFSLVVTTSFIILPLIVGKIPDRVPFTVYIMFLFGFLGLKRGLYFRKRKKIKEVIKNRQLPYRIAVKSGFLLALLVGVLFLILPLIFTESKYVNEVDIPTAKRKLQTAMTEYDGIDFFNKFGNGYFTVKANGGVNQGQLGRVAEVKFKNITALEIRITGEAENTYLKAYAGSIYNGDNWSEFDNRTKKKYQRILDANKDYQDVSNLGSYLIEQLNLGYTYGNTLELDHLLSHEEGYHEQKMVIKNVAADKNAVYIPYYANILESTDYSKTESYVKANKALEEYDFTYYTVDKDILFDADWDTAFNSSINAVNTNNHLLMYYSNLSAYHQLELAYRTYVYDNYLQVPNKGMERLRDTIFENSFDEILEQDGSFNLSKTISYVKNFIQKDTKYSLSPGTLPAGKDFVDYFLFEKKEGYCTHYATSATIIFRMLGIPARYVEGYVIKSSDFSKGKKQSIDMYTKNNGEQEKKTVGIYQLEIKDSNAHAWVEVYVDGFGWVPVEVTPGIIRETQNHNSEIEDIKKEITPTVTPKPVVTQKIDKQPSTVKPIDNHKTKATTASIIIQVILFVVKILIGLILILCILILRALFIRKRRTKLANLKNNNEKVLFYYELLTRVIRSYRLDLKNMSNEEFAIALSEKCMGMKADYFLKYMDIMKKAKFSHHLLNEKEQKYAKDFYNTFLLYHYCNQPWYKKLYDRYIKVF